MSTPINMVSQRLAEHYGIPGVEGVRFRRVDVDQTKNTRGGFLTMAAVCKVTANGSTTSPVKRGANPNLNELLHQVIQSQLFLNK